MAKLRKYASLPSMNKPVQTRLSPHLRWCLHRAFVTMLIVGPILTLINQWERLWPFDPNWWKVALTFIVPFAVSLSGSLPKGKRDPGS